MIEKDGFGKYYGVCDCCYEHSDYGADTYNSCKHLMKEDGWVFRHNSEDEITEHICPECKELKL